MMRRPALLQSICDVTQHFRVISSKWTWQPDTQSRRSRRHSSGWRCRAVVLPRSDRRHRTQGDRSEYACHMVDTAGHGSDRVDERDWAALLVLRLRAVGGRVGDAGMGGPRNARRLLARALWHRSSATAAADPPLDPPGACLAGSRGCAPDPRSCRWRTPKHSYHERLRTTRRVAARPPARRPPAPWRTNASRRTAYAGGVDVVLHRHEHAMKQSEPTSLVPSRIRGCRGTHCAVAV